MTKLEKEYYLNPDVVFLSQDLIGKTIMTLKDGILTGGVIKETEAYMGPFDKASHAYNNRRTPRNEIMYADGGVAYVFICYGMHHLLNVVTNIKDVPHAILIRGIEPTIGVEVMHKRRNGKFPLTNGPGTVSQALGISKKDNGCSFLEDRIWIEDSSSKKLSIKATPRIGIDYAQEHAQLPWRFILDKPKANK